MKKLTMKTRNEVIQARRKQYQKSTKKGKSNILTTVCESTGLSRDRAGRLLRTETILKKCKLKVETRGRKVKYDKSVKVALEWIWPLLDFACGKRLVPGMPLLLDALERHGELKFDVETLQKLRQISAFTVDKLLAPARKSATLKGRSTTKPGTLLKNNIPQRLGTQWDDAIPGYVEIDLVAHCGDTTAGDYVNTLDVTDICTGWTETGAVLNKARKHVFERLMDIEYQLPFPYTGIDSDNGSEFINAHLYKYCSENNICFTRSRPYTKNDNCHVEQKNWALIRRNVGYSRYEGEEAVNRLNKYYQKLRLHFNFFLPQTKLISRHRDKSKVHKKYETPKTPYLRVMESIHVSDNVKKELTDVFMTLNPVTLKKDMVMLLSSLKEIRIPWDGYHTKK